MVLFKKPLPFVGGGFFVRFWRSAVGRVLPKPTLLISEANLADEERPSPQNLRH